VSETEPSEQTEVAQTDHESQEFGVQHGQDITGQETGSSSPETEGEEGRREAVEDAGECAGVDHP